MNFNRVYIVLLFISQISFSQEGLPVYSDYLSDNYYLIHPSMAGASNCAKLRFTGRQQWFGQEDAPSLQTLSLNGKIGEKSGAGVILINDKNGYHAQKGMKLTYAHHIMFSRDAVDLNQFSFGMTAGFFQSVLDETTFQGFDPIVYGGMQQKASYFNVDIGASYNYLDFYTHLTIKNALASQRKLYTDKEPVDLKSVLFSAGYTFGDKERLLWEPSFMVQSIIQTRENLFDLNLKVYKQLNFGKLWGAISYRRSLEGAEYVEGRSTTSNQKLQMVTPIIGLNYNNFMISYTYSQHLGSVQFDSVGFHQITLGFNLFCQEERYHCNCPAIN